jgi:hypothetical protein
MVVGKIITRNVTGAQISCDITGIFHELEMLSVDNF